jgi:hypothetical protein
MSIAADSATALGLPRNFASAARADWDNPIG